VPQWTTSGPETDPAAVHEVRPGRIRRGRRRRPLRDRRGARIALAVAVAAFGWLAWSVGHALTAPGGGTVSERLAEWARDHYLGPLVTLGEWITYEPPKVGGKPSFALKAPDSARVPLDNPAAAKSAQGQQVTPIFPARLASPAGRPLPGEGVWRVLGSVNGIPAMFGTYLRPDRVHTSYVEGIVSMDQRLVRFQLHPGAEDPGPGSWKSPPDIPPGSRTGLLATFNGGFKIATAGGGFYLNGTSKGPLQRGAASMVYYRDGRLNIGTWGTDVHMTSQVRGVRQNLKLIVDHGKVPASVDVNVQSNWGATLGGGEFVWRSGVGISSDGRIIFGYGPALNVRDLADLLQRAGCVRAMQLDINPDWMSFMYYRPGRHPADPTPVNLLPDQIQPPQRFYSIASRDFTAVFAR
jgi:Phosphodiester glycosidase